MEDTVRKIFELTTGDVTMISGEIVTVTETATRDGWTTLTVTNGSRSWKTTRHELDACR